MTAGERRPLVIGYGAALRGDDAVGWYVADLIACDPRFIDVDVLSVHQLTPEIAADVAAASRVVLIDAADDGGPPGAVRVVDIRPYECGSGAFSHHVDAATLVMLADEIFHRAPPTSLVTVSLKSTAHEQRLTAPVAGAIPAVVEAVANLCLEAANA
jgi:hydrogenase maturation protease